jgi:hypothetical protein
MAGNGCCTGEEGVLRGVEEECECIVDEGFSVGSDGREGKEGSDGRDGMID